MPTTVANNALCHNSPPSVKNMGFNIGLCVAALKQLHLPDVDNAWPQRLLLRQHQSVVSTGSYVCIGRVIMHLTWFDVIQPVFINDVHVSLILGNPVLVKMQRQASDLKNQTSIENSMQIGHIWETEQTMIAL